MDVTVPLQKTSSKKSGRSSSRRHARQLALQLLFQKEFHPNDDRWVEDFWVNQTASPEEKDFANHIVQGVFTHRAELDASVNRYARDWSIDRMPMVDRNILRWGIYELLWEPEIPAKVTVNEAIELAKRFADEDAGKFINGILDHILRDDSRLESKRANATEIKKTESFPKSNSKFNRIEPSS